MRALVKATAGPGFELRDVPQPSIRDNEVLIRVRATSVNPYDWHTMRGEPRVARLMGGTLGPRRRK